MSEGGRAKGGTAELERKVEARAMNGSGKRTEARHEKDESMTSSKDDSTEERGREGGRDRER